jgi:hypothetical protein
MKSKTITTTRFNNDTFQQNRHYIDKTKIQGCIYGTPMKMKSNIPMESSVFVIEMNNDKNKIEGIGLINNRLILDKNYRIYKDMDYNRYIYKGKHRLDTAIITDDFYKQVIYVLEQVLFKGERHCKRSHGITKLSDWITNNRHEFDFIKCIDNMFNKYLFSS